MGIGPINTKPPTAVDEEVVVEEGMLVILPIKTNAKPIKTRSKPNPRIDNLIIYILLLGFITVTYECITGI